MPITAKIKSAPKPKLQWKTRVQSKEHSVQAIKVCAEAYFYGEDK